MTTDKGSVLIYSLLMMATILAISLTMTAIFVPKLRVSREAIGAVNAIFAAESGAERCLYEARKQIDDVYMYMVGRPPGSNQEQGGDIDNGAKFAIEDLFDAPGTVITLNCKPIGDDGIFQFRSVGTYIGTNRAVEIRQ